MSSMLALLASFGALPGVAKAQVSGAVEPTVSPKSAETEIYSEIVVTAQRRAERSVDVPITVTTLGADQIATANVRDLSDISRVTPSLRFDNAAAFAQPTIRGIGTAVVTSGVGSNVGIYIDGFYSPNPLAANSQLLNVQSIQVLKGPQGTLFGRNTTGGAILIQSKEPSEDPAASVKVSYGRFNQLVTQGYATYGLAPGLAIDAEGMYRRGDGFQTNIVDGNNKIGKYESWSVRLGLKMDFSDSVSLLVRYMHGNVDDPTSMNANSYFDPVLGVGAPNFAPPSSYTANPSLVAKDRAGIFTSKNDTLQATWKVDLGIADLTSYTQYRTEDVNLSQDLDATGLPIFQIGIPVLNQTFSQEILLSAKPGEPLQWTAGLFYFSNKDRYQTYLDTGGAFRTPAGPNRLGGSSTTTKSYAAFVDATYELVSQLFLTAGVRYAHDSVTDAYYSVGTNNFYVPSISSDKVTPRAVIRYKPSDESSIYASYSKGYKAAILDVGGSCQNPPAFQCNVVRPEDVNAFEVGAKFDNRRLSIEAAAFYYDYKNLQVSSYLGDGRANITNAATSEIYGVEGSLRYELSRQFSINGGASWTHARYKEFTNAPVYQRCPTIAGCGFGTSFFIPAGTTLNNVPMQRTPEFTGNVGARYKTDLAGGEFQLSGNLYYTSSFNFGPAGIQFPQKAYEVATARAQWTDPSDTYTIALWGDNLTNNRYLTAVQYNSFGLGANWSAPTTYGIELGAKF
ncbi:TonB-dependent receptor [Sphingobium sufflavum]|uniref:TonB-dependent receptor n=1 Tax=Sphingobium sufflavum TaxID=1129547 RepID=UPI001F48B47C|nr:TonB-dependent receptor [Sphingobium sufflavum]MCE7796726.1 TonB-dependent receptor [Sphingobium sufflavum]